MVILRYTNYMCIEEVYYVVKPFSLTHKELSKIVIELYKIDVLDLNQHDIDPERLTSSDEGIEYLAESGIYAGDLIYKLAERDKSRVYNIIEMDNGEDEPVTYDVGSLSIIEVMDQLGDLNDIEFHALRGSNEMQR